MNYIEVCSLVLSVLALVISFASPIYIDRQRKRALLDTPSLSETSELQTLIHQKYISYLTGYCQSDNRVMTVDEAEHYLKTGEDLRCVSKLHANA